MNKNDTINSEIRKRTDGAKSYIMSCKSFDDPEVLTYDGIIKEGDNPPELLFLLKEANDGRNSKNKNKPDFSNGFDFVEETRKAAKTNEKLEHWKNLCYWTKAFEDAKKHNPHYFGNPEVENCGSLLGEIALVNIKKVPGEGKINAESFDKTVNNPQCAKLIRDEISLISPEIVVCCGTYRYIKNIYRDYNITEDKLESGVDYFIYNNICYIDFLHPKQYGAAAKSNLLYAYAKEVFSSLLNYKENTNN